MAAKATWVTLTLLFRPSTTPLESSFWARK